MIIMTSPLTLPTEFFQAWNRYRTSNPADNALSSLQLLLCGLAAGTCAKAVCHPLDVVKKRFQVYFQPSIFYKLFLLVHSSF